MNNLVSQLSVFILKTNEKIDRKALIELFAKKHLDVDDFSEKPKKCFAKSLSIHVNDKGRNLCLRVFNNTLQLSTSAGITDVNEAKQLCNRMIKPLLTISESKVAVLVLRTKLTPEQYAKTETDSRLIDHWQKTFRRRLCCQVKSLPEFEHVKFLIFKNYTVSISGKSVDECERAFKSLVE